MNSLPQILTNLCEGKDLGALVITKDGMVIDSQLGEDYESEALSAFMSQVALTIKTSLASLDHHEFTRYIIETNQGKIYLVDLGKSVLIALASSDVKAAEINVALFQAASEIKKTGRIDI